MPVVFLPLPGAPPISAAPQIMTLPQVVPANCGPLSLATSLPAVNATPAMPYEPTLVGTKRNSEDVSHLMAGTIDNGAKKIKTDLNYGAVSKVVHIRSLPSDVTDSEAIQLGMNYGRVTNVLMLKGKNQAFLEMEDEETAQHMVASCNLSPPVIRQRPIYVQFSNHKELKTDNSPNQLKAQAVLQALQQLDGGTNHKAQAVLQAMQQTEGGPNHVLRVVVENMLYPVTLEVLHTIFSKFGAVLKIITFTKNSRIVVIPGKIEEISLPEKVDVIVSEPMGYMLFNERMLETYLHSKKFLKQPNGMMFPTVGDLHIAPFSDEQLYMEQFTKANFWYQQSFHGIDLSPLRDDAVSEYFRQPIVDTFDVRILMAKSVKHTVNFLTTKEEDLYRIEIPLHFTAHTSGTVHGFAFWFDMAFVGTIATVWLSTAPTEALTHWYQVRCLLRSPLFIKAGEVLLGKVVLRSNKRQSYDIDLEAMVEATGCKSENCLDLKNPFFHYNGQAPSAPPGSHGNAPSDPYSSGVISASGGYGEVADGNSHPQQQISNSSQQSSMCYQQILDPAQVAMHNYAAAQCNVVPLLTGGSIPHPGTIGTSSMKTTISSGNPQEQFQQTSPSAQYVHY